MRQPVEKKGDDQRGNGLGVGLQAGALGGEQGSDGNGAVDRIAGVLEDQRDDPPRFALNAAMILFGWVMEVHNQTTARTNWIAYWFGCFAGIVPWIAVAIYLVAQDPPAFVYAVYASIFAFFNIFAVNMALHYRRAGRWRDYLYGERVYMLLSLFAKSALAWRVFAGTLQPA